jgi:hypothetical protein
MIDGNFPGNDENRLTAFDNVPIENFGSAHPMLVDKCPVAAFQIADLRLFAVMLDLEMTTGHEFVAQADFRRCATAEYNRSVWLNQELSSSTCFFGGEN